MGPLMFEARQLVLTLYGLPYLAGSGVKGMPRRAAEERLDDGGEDVTENGAP